MSKNITKSNGAIVVKGKDGKIKDNISTRGKVAPKASDVKKSHKGKMEVTDKLPATNLPKCIMLENYSGLHFWTTIKDGNVEKAAKEITKYVSTHMPVASLYRQITGEVEDKAKAGKGLSFVQIG